MEMVQNREITLTPVSYAFGNWIGDLQRLVMIGVTEINFNISEVFSG